MKRSRRGGGRRPQNGHNGHSGGGGGGGGNSGGGFNPNRSYDSSGPEVKIRGTASHIYEKYLQLARDANASGDRVMAENYLQHAEHYYRIMAAAQAQQAAWQAQQAAQQPRPANGTGDQPGVAPAAGSTSAPSFSLAEGQEGDDEGEDEGEEAEVAE